MCALTRVIIWQGMKCTEAIIPEMMKAYEPQMTTYGWWGRKVCDQLRARAWPWTPQSREPSVPDYLSRNSWKWCFEEGSQILPDIGPEPPSQRRNAANHGRSRFSTIAVVLEQVFFLKSHQVDGCSFCLQPSGWGHTSEAFMLQMDPELSGPIWSGPFARWIFWGTKGHPCAKTKWFPLTE